jgi:hypothetical protein
LIHFKEENAPIGSTERCTDGCKVKNTCPYNATRIYENHPEFKKLAVDKEGFDNISEAMQKGRYGKCVYKCDNNVVDHQVINILFDNNTTATLTMCAFETDRKSYIMGTKGKIYASFEKSTITVEDFRTDDKVTYEVNHSEAGHGGADEVLIRDFVSMVQNKTDGFTNIQTSVQSHAMCHAAEISRLENRNVELAELI